MPTLHERPFVTRLSVALASSGVLLVLSGFLIGSTPDEEEFRFAILSSWLHVRSLLHGDYVFWTSALGLGIPHPLTPNFLLHPLLPLLAIVGPVSWVRILLLAHTVLGATGMWQLTKSLAMTPPTRAICVFTFLLATPTQNYVLTNFWPSHYVVWTSMPWLLLLTWRALDAEGMSLRRLSIALGLCGGLVIANTNPGHVIVYTTLAAAVATTSVRRLAARWRWMAVAALIAAAIASPTFAQLAHERRVLDPNSSLSNVTDPLEASEMWSALISPWTAPGAAPVGSDVTFTRTLFFGGPFVVLALGGCVLFARRRLDLVLVVTACAVLLFTRTLSLSFVSARFEFRDPLTLAAILLAGLVLDRLLAHRPTRAIAVYVLIAQVGVVGDTAWPFLQGTRGPDAATAMWFHGGTGNREHIDRLLTLMPLAGRVLFSPQVDDDVYELARLQEGLGRNALAYRRVSLVNGWFKGVSTNTIWPDEQLFYGRIRAPQSLLERCRARCTRYPIRAGDRMRTGRAGSASARCRAQQGGRNVCGLRKHQPMARCVRDGCSERTDRPASAAWVR